MVFGGSGGAVSSGEMGPRPDQGLTKAGNLESLVSANGNDAVERARKGHG